MSDQKKLSVYTNDDEWVIAESPDDVVDVLVALGQSIADCGEVWMQCPDEKQFTFLGDDDSIPRTQTFAEWAAERGRGYFATVNY